MTVSRRKLFASGACAVVGAVALPGAKRANAAGEQNLANEEIIRRWYAAWENKDLATFNELLADDFTFTSAAGDDHISNRELEQPGGFDHRQLLGAVGVVDGESAGLGEHDHQKCRSHQCVAGNDVRRTGE
jgi:hypothetical protein